MSHILRILSAVLEPGSVPGMHTHHNNYHCAVVVVVVLLLLAQRRSHEQELLLDGIPTGMTILIKIIIKYIHPPYCAVFHRCCESALWSLSPLSFWFGFGSVMIIIIGSALRLELLATVIADMLLRLVICGAKLRSTHSVVRQCIHALLPAIIAADLQSTDITTRQTVDRPRRMYSTTCQLAVCVSVYSRCAICASSVIFIINVQMLMLMLLSVLCCTDRTWVPFAVR